MHLSSPADACSTSGTALTGHLFCFHTFVAVRDERPYGNADLRSGFLGALVEAIFFQSPPNLLTLHCTWCRALSATSAAHEMFCLADRIRWSTTTIGRPGGIYKPSRFPTAMCLPHRGVKRARVGRLWCLRGDNHHLADGFNIPVSVPDRAWLGCASRNRANVIVLFFSSSIQSKNYIPFEWEEELKHVA